MNLSFFDFHIFLISFLPLILKKKDLEMKKSKSKEPNANYKEKKCLFDFQQKIPRVVFWFVCIFAVFFPIVDFS